MEILAPLRCHVLLQLGSMGMQALPHHLLVLQLHRMEMKAQPHHQMVLPLARMKCVPVVFCTCCGDDT